MICRYWLYAFTVVTLALTGSANIVVYSEAGDKSSSSGRLNGIPFYVNPPLASQAVEVALSLSALQFR